MRSCTWEKLTSHANNDQKSRVMFNFTWCAAPTAWLQTNACDVGLKPQNAPPAKVCGSGVVHWWLERHCVWNVSKISPVRVCLSENVLQKVLWQMYYARTNSHCTHSKTHCTHTDSRCIYFNPHWNHSHAIRYPWLSSFFRVRCSTSTQNKGEKEEKKIQTMKTTQTIKKGDKAPALASFIAGYRTLTPDLSLRHEWYALYGMSRGTSVCQQHVCVMDSVKRDFWQRE